MTTPFLSTICFDQVPVAFDTTTDKLASSCVYFIFYILSSGTYNAFNAAAVCPVKFNCKFWAMHSSLESVPHGSTIVVSIMQSG